MEFTLALEFTFSSQLFFYQTCIYLFFMIFILDSYPIVWA